MERINLAYLCRSLLHRETRAKPRTGGCHHRIQGLEVMRLLASQLVDWLENPLVERVAESEKTPLGEYSNRCGLHRILLHNNVALAHYYRVGSNRDQLHSHRLRKRLENDVRQIKETNTKFDTMDLALPPSQSPWQI